MTASDEAAWSTRVAAIADELGVESPRVQFVRGSAVAGASYHPWTDRLKIRRSWIGKVGGDPHAPAASFLLAHELGHKKDRVLVLVRVLLVVLVIGGWVAATLVSKVFADVVIIPALIALLIASSHWFEYRADDVAATYLGGVDALASWLLVAPAGSGTGPTHPSDSSRIVRQERRLGRRSGAVDFESAVAVLAVSRGARLRYSGRALAAGLVGLGKQPFDRRKWLAITTGAFAIVWWGTVFATKFGVWSVLAAPFALGVFALAFWPLTYVFAPGSTLVSRDRVAALRVVARRAVPGLYEVRSYTRWPLTAATKLSAARLGSGVVDLADAHDVALLALPASERLDEHYKSRFGFVDAPPKLCELLSPARSRRYLVRWSRSGTSGPGILVGATADVRSRSSR